ncbi:1876_t:CDS:10 [Funneliformis geosporum]|uniref:3155_t:CDS:1 n=1 Tax=Funneliformis geosporum TaxID=1117311 RepID=A0A9W4SUH7_9GLOM|nr:3155_t:CDS:10 [Funneliformis geosporum]CAI2183849.1 1876_t:CDS:10 [Funneliformis geosporum]
MLATPFGRCLAAIVRIPALMTHIFPVSTLSPTPWRLLTRYCDLAPTHRLCTTDTCLDDTYFVLVSTLSPTPWHQQMDLYRQINNYFDTVKYSEWSILDCLYSIQNPMFTSDSADEVATIIKDIIGTRRISNSLLASVKRKLEHLESKFESIWTNSEVRQYFSKLDLSHTNKMYETRAMTNIVKDKTVLNDAHTQDLANSYAENSKKRQQPENTHYYESKQRRIADNDTGDKSETGPNDEVDFDYNKVSSMDSNIDSDADDHKVFRDYDEYCEEEISIEKILSSGRDVSVILSKYREKIPRTKAYLYPAYFGILDLSGEDIEVKNLFTDDEWNEMIKDFKSNVNLSDLEPEQNEPFYKLMDKIIEVLAKNPHDLITGIESCVIEENIKVNAIRRLIQTYAYNLQLRLPMSEVAFGSNFTNMVTKGILTFGQTYHYEEGEIQSLASSVISNLKTKPAERSLIGQKVDFRISKDQFEMLIGLRSGGLPTATKGKKRMDKVDLAVSLRDVLANEGMENNGVEPSRFQKLFVLGVHSYNYNYNIYGLDWCKGVWRLGLLQKVKLPTSFDYLPAIEKFIISLLRVEETLHRIRKTHYEIFIEKSRLYRNRRTSLRVMDYSICEQGRTTRTRKAKE